VLDFRLSEICSATYSLLSNSTNSTADSKDHIWHLIASHHVSSGIYSTDSVLIFNTYLGCWLRPFCCSVKEAASMEKANQEIISTDHTSICLQHTKKCIPLVRSLAWY
jgi:hypothetical protein